MVELNPAARQRHYPNRRKFRGYFPPTIVTFQRLGGGCPLVLKAGRPRTMHASVNFSSGHRFKSKCLAGNTLRRILRGDRYALYACYAYEARVPDLVSQISCQFDPSFVARDPAVLRS